MKKPTHLLILLMLLPGISNAKCTVCSHRTSTAKYQFKKQTGYAHGRPGYVIDHIIALKRGGLDSPGNMQWMDIKAAKLKDRWE